jgi:hypothetical protein
MRFDEIKRILNTLFQKDLVPVVFDYLFTQNHIRLTNHLTRIVPEIGLQFDASMFSRYYTDEEFQLLDWKSGYEFESQIYESLESEVDRDENTKCVFYDGIDRGIMEPKKFFKLINLNWPSIETIAFEQNYGTSSIEKYYKAFKHKKCAKLKCIFISYFQSHLPLFKNISSRDIGIIWQPILDLFNEIHLIIANKDNGINELLWVQKDAMGTNMKFFERREYLPLQIVWEQNI